MGILRKQTKSEMRREPKDLVLILQSVQTRKQVQDRLGSFPANRVFVVDQLRVELFQGLLVLISALREFHGGA